MAGPDKGSCVNLSQALSLSFPNINQCTSSEIHFHTDKEPHHTQHLSTRKKTPQGRIISINSKFPLFGMELWACSPNNRGIWGKGMQTAAFETLCKLRCPSGKHDSNMPALLDPLCGWPSPLPTTMTFAEPACSNLQINYNNLFLHWPSGLHSVTSWVREAPNKPQGLQKVQKTGGAVTHWGLKVHSSSSCQCQSTVLGGGTA